MLSCVDGTDEEWSEGSSVQLRPHRTQVVMGGKEVGLGQVSRLPLSRNSETPVTGMDTGMLDPDTSSCGISLVLCWPSQQRRG